MTTHDGGWPAGTPCWVDTMANDLERSQAFYRAVLGWDFSGGGEEFGGYTNASVNGRLVAGVMPTHPSMAEAPKAWTVYLATDDAAATAAAVEEAGGRIISPVTQVGDLGAMAICNDNTGMPFGLWQAGTHGGFGTFDEPGSAAWLDLMTPSFAGAQEFYAAVFGYTYQSMGMAGQDYAMFTVPGGERPAGGIGGASEEMGEGWSVAFAVASVDDAVAAVEAAGGTVTGAPYDFEFGRLAHALGPDGESFSLFAPSAQSGGNADANGDADAGADDTV
ncbi:MAG TPA: VOC family protein [Dermatophilaceae bacterium]|nr:VOC family protein [Dermatophilaceae bacterium]